MTERVRSSEGAPDRPTSDNAGDAGEGSDAPVGSDGPSSADYSVAFSPRQVAVGFAIVAGLVALVAARRRRRRSVPDD
jgi:hypothetical protein